MSHGLPIEPGTYEEQRATFMHKASEEPRLITAEEVVAERKAYDALGLESAIYSWQKGVCAEFFDPSGEETAKYLNMEFSPAYMGTTKLPDFTWSMLARSSYLAHLKPGFYIGNAKKPALLQDVLTLLRPPFPMKPKRLLYISPEYLWDEFILSACRRFWTHYTYIRGQSVWYKPEEYDAVIPCAEFAQRLSHLYHDIPVNLARYPLHN
jgi:hypothetical protein